MEPLGTTVAVIDAPSGLESDRDLVQPCGTSRVADTSSLISGLKSITSVTNKATLVMLDLIAECERAGVWEDDGCRDLIQWLAAHTGITNLKARRLINVAHVLPSLPLTRAAFEAGKLSLDQILELCRFATPETERKLIRWAKRVTVMAIRHKAEVSSHTDKKEAAELDNQRWLSYWFYEDSKLMGLQGCLPADQGAVIAKALDRLAGRLPDIIDDDGKPEHPEGSLDMRRADALYALASKQIADDQDPDRATVVVHAELDALVRQTSGCEIENDGVIHPETCRRLLCDGRLQTVVHNSGGAVVGIGHASRTIPRWLLRLIRHRDRTCTFPGCERRFFLQAHHIKHWIELGPTNLDNLALVCLFHHKLVHEYGWSMKLGPGDLVSWYRPNGSLFDPG
jgi:hypothetical protein